MARTAIVSVRIVGNASNAERELLRAARAAERFQNRMNNLGRTVALNSLKTAAKAASNFSFAIAAVGFAAPIAASAVVALGSAAVGMAAMAGAAFAAVKLGMDGIKKAAATASPALDALKASTSAAFEQTMIPGFQQLSTLMGTITPQMTGLAGAIGTSFTSMATAITTQGSGAIQGIIANAQTFIAGITPGLQSLLLGILSLANQASQVVAGAAPQISALLGSIGDKLAGVTADQIVQAFTDLRDRALELWNAIQPIVTAFQTMADHAALMFQLALALKAIQIAAGLASAATSIYALAQLALNAAFWSNPITWVVIGILALIAVIVIIATKTTWFQTIWEIMVNRVVTVWGWITNAISVFAGWIVGVWNGIVSGATTAWNIVQAVATVVWAAIQAVVQGVADFIGSAISAACDIASSVFETVGSVASGVWGGMKSVIDTVAGAISTVVGWVQTLISWLGNIKWPSAPGWLSGLLGAGPTAAFKAVPGGLDFFRFLPSVPLLGAAPAPALSAADFGPGSGAFGRGAAMQAQVTNINITIEGAVDPMSTARQVRNLLTNLDTTTGMKAAVKL